MKERIKKIIKFQINFEIVKQNGLVLVFRFMYGEYRVMHNGYVIDSHHPDVLTAIIDDPELVIKQVRQIKLLDVLSDLL